MEYNTERELIVISEYGRCVQEMINHLLTIEDPAKRQKNAEAVVETMAILNNQHKGVEDYKQKFWDHLYEITDWKLDVESPYGVPDRAEREAKPDPLSYPSNKIKWNHLGKNVELLFEKAKAETDEDKKKGYAQALGNYMKIAYKNYHEENVTDENVKEEITNMSKGDLQYNANEFKKWVDGTLSESETVVGIRNHKMNKNYDEATGRNKGNFRNNFGKNSGSQGGSSSNNNRFGNKNFKYKK
jgi:Domain of unknown function (DUF4290)